MTTDREVCYITREVVQQALDQKSTARSAGRIDQCIAAAGRDVEGLTHRRFYPWVGTRYKDWPTPSGSSFRVWLDADEVISVATLVSAGQTLDPDDYFLEPANELPYNRVEINRGTAGSFTAGDTPQRNLGITGVFMGCELREIAAGALAVTIDADDATIDVTDGSLVGVGSLLRIGTERLQVFEKYTVDTTQTINADLAAAANGVTVAVDDGTAVHIGEVLLIESERMLVVDVAGNNVTVKRAWDGSVLATHTSGAEVYAYRRCAVTRGALGTVAAGHTAPVAVYAHQAPSLVQELSLAYALNNLLQGSSGYAREVGSGDNQREATGRGIQAIEDDTYQAYGRKARIRSSA